ncbi:hypothetical protein [Nocardioides plantarum]|uniref:Uncharacterized protein n=1 Tax=Nocardioides plantarum TaxID=29299 RepID=A0ABV5KJ44_9ACTN|nr:hypothetical protein [Nocardioides plantarum]
MAQEREIHSHVVDGVRHFWWTETLWVEAAGLPVTSVPIADIAEFDQNCWFGATPPTCREVAEHARRIEVADLSYPVILNVDGGLMDGGHRIARAWLDGLTEVDAVRFEVLPAPSWTMPEVVVQARRKRAETLFVHEVTPHVRFRTNGGRPFEPRGTSAGEFIVVNGTLESGPRYRNARVARFHASVVSPPGDTSYAMAALHYPADPDLVAEKDCHVVLWALAPQDVPAGTVISSIGVVET